ncbi:MAG: endo-1,4-beta-xylanase [Phycisphaeraceae bacterium]
MKRAIGFILVILTICSRPCGAQLLNAPWVKESQERIEEIRKVPVRIIVLDEAGDPVPRATVRIDMLRHAFPFGLHVSKAVLQCWPSKDAITEAPLWRCFNSISLDRLTDWLSVQPEKDKWDFSAVEPWLQLAKERSLIVRWGGVVPSDAGRMPRWAAGLKGGELAGALEGHVRRVLNDYGQSVVQFDLISQTIDHRYIEEELGLGMVRRLHRLAETEVPGLPARSPLGRAALQLDDAFGSDRLQKAMRRVTAMREGFVDIDALAIEVRLSGSIVEAPVTRSLMFLGDPGLPVMITRLEVAGSSDTGAAINLETALRVMFSQPGVKGIWLAGLHAEDFQDTTAALLDKDGKLTASGELFDQLVHKLWWSNVSETTDDIGNVRARVFAGVHRIIATLPDGRQTMTDVNLNDAAAGERIIVLQPRGGKKDAPAAKVRTIFDGPGERPTVDAGRD